MPATSNRAQVGVVREVTPGTMPASPAFQTLRVTSGGLTATPKTVVSAEVTPDGMQTDIAIVGKDVGGSIDAELTNKTFDLFLEEACRQALTKSPEVNGATSVAISGVYNFASGPVFVIGHYVRATGFTNTANNGYFRVTAQTATQITTDNAGSVVEASPPATSRIKAVGYKAAANGDTNATSSGGNHIVSALNPASFGLVAGMWFKALNFAGTAADNGFYRVSSIAGAGPYNIFCDVVPTGFTTDTAAAAKVVIGFTDYVRNGTTRLAHSTEKAMLDAPAPIYDYRLGDQVGQLTIDSQHEQIVKVSAACMAMDQIVASVTRAAGASTVAAGTSAVMNASTGLQRVAEALVQLNGGTQNLPLGGKVMLNNNLRAQPAEGQLALAGIGFGTYEVTGEVEVYLDTPTMLQKLWANTVSSFDMRFADSNGDGYIFDIPTIKFSNGDNAMPAQNSDVTPNMAFRGLVTVPSAGTRYVIHVQKFEQVA